jgi:hypothetical protein
VYAEDLVTSGVAHCRNPMYVGNLLMLAGVAMGSNSWTCVLVAIPVFTFVYMAIVAAEETFLRDKFGAAFDGYTRDVPRWIPRWSDRRMRHACPVCRRDRCFNNPRAMEDPLSQEKPQNRRRLIAMPLCPRHSIRVAFTGRDVMAATAP